MPTDKEEIHRLETIIEDLEHDLEKERDECREAQEEVRSKEFQIELILKHVEEIEDLIEQGTAWGMLTPEKALQDIGAEIRRCKNNPDLD